MISSIFKTLKDNSDLISCGKATRLPIAFTYQHFGTPKITYLHLVSQRINL
jgi:hypothetical protein